MTDKLPSQELIERANKIVAEYAMSVPYHKTRETLRELATALTHAEQREIDAAAAATECNLFLRQRAERAEQRCRELERERNELRLALRPFTYPFKDEQHIEPEQVIELQTRNDVLRLELIFQDFLDARAAIAAERKLASPAPGWQDAVEALKRLASAGRNLQIGIDKHNSLSIDAPARLHDISGPVVSIFDEALGFAREVLLSLPASGTLAGWRTIESAPKNEQAFLVFIPDDRFSPDTGIEVMWWEASENAFLVNGEPLGPHQKPSHWMPLPAPPVETGK